MSLTWNDYRGIAQALAQRHPDVDRFDLDDETLRQMIVAMPEFTDRPDPPDEDAVQDVLAAWYQLDEESDDGQFDPEV